MKELNLSVCGGDNREISFADLDLIDTPASTSSWTPIPHTHLIRVVREQLALAGIAVVKEYHTTARYGLRYFGLIQVDMQRDEDDDGRGSAMVIALRNSHDKCFPAALAVGSAPWICSNLQLSNEIVLGRRHTLNIVRDLPKLVSRAIGMLSSLWNSHLVRETAYREIYLNSEAAADLILRGFKAGACNKTAIADVLAQWENSEHEDFRQGNLWGLYNAFTEVSKGNLVALQGRCDALHSVFDSYAGLNAGKSVDVSDVVTVDDVAE